MTITKGSACTDSDTHALHKQWDELSCPICMEHPHNAVLLLCSSYDSGCRCYICDTSYRHSNCLDRLKKLRTNHPGIGSFLHDMRSSISYSVSGEQSIRWDVVESHDEHSVQENSGGISLGVAETVRGGSEQSLDGHLEAHGLETTNVTEDDRGHETELSGVLRCPLCRGKVTGWKVVQETRKYLDLKSRTCSREACSFSGNYRKLRKHARGVHPSTRPADAEPSRQHAWHQLERQREYGDIVSAIRSAMPGAVVFGDYIIDHEEGNMHGLETNNALDEGSGPWWTTFFLFHMFRNPLTSIDELRSSSRLRRAHPRRSSHHHLWGENLLGLEDDDDGDDLDLEMSIPRRRRRIARPRQDHEMP